VTYLYGDLPRQPVEGDQRNLKSSDPSRMSPSGLRPSSAVIPDEIRPPAERLPGGIPEGGGEFGQEDSGIGRTSLDDALRSISEARPRSALFPTSLVTKQLTRRTFSKWRPSTRRPR